MKQTKIQVAIEDSKLRLKKVEENIMLMLREKEVLQAQIRNLEIIQDNKDYE